MRKKNATKTAVSGREIIAIIKTEALLHIVHIVIPHTLQALPTVLTVIPALARAIWQTCSVPVAIICTMIPPAELFTATAK